LPASGDDEGGEDPDHHNPGNLAGHCHGIGLADHEAGRCGVEHSVDATIQLKSRAVRAAALSGGRSATAACNESDNADA
jgi:hypothetical protein